ncbi:TetR family transcriptional regulator [Saccharopolyspora rhizosphaerae]|uniref:TetR family transcriptional regulator n=1 Tax=Saccharopolyspora rhizosphaerae TaxID=2492662 RepID=A0A426JV47_9PSEU|nr:TetR family transcriptional regulator C-terminal domain-containing protein [Saccharopolyspora rhizosphaerae]RRO16997.1 TetR family transcriptional regulator [Saccharopolyspora rhizosphaerae]
MNKIDAVGRRRVLAEAVWRIILRDGLPSVSVRSVAQEAGLAAGSVRHFFPAQDELVNFAMTALVEVVTARVQAAAQTPDVRERVFAMLVELLPVTDRTHGEFAAYLEFLGRSRTDVSLRAVAWESIRAVRELVVTVLTDLRSLGMLRPELDVEVEAVRLHAFLDGLTLHLIVAPELNSRDDARRALGRWLQDLWSAGPDGGVDA